METVVPPTALTEPAIEPFASTKLTEPAKTPPLMVISPKAVSCKAPVPATAEFTVVLMPESFT